VRNSSEFGDKYLEALAVCQNASRAIKYMWGLAEETQVAGVGKKERHCSSIHMDFTKILVD